MKALVKTNLTVGLSKDFKFGPRNTDSIKMHDNPAFEQEYTSIEEFLAQFAPLKPSNNLMNAIESAFTNGGSFTFKPNGYKANMTFTVEAVESVDEPVFEPLTLEKARSLVGKKVILSYDNYEGKQFAVDFDLGEVINCWDVMRDDQKAHFDKIDSARIRMQKQRFQLVDADGVAQPIFCNSKSADQVFWIADPDNQVSFKLA